MKSWPSSKVLRKPYDAGSKLNQSFLKSVGLGFLVHVRRARNCTSSVGVFRDPDPFQLLALDTVPRRAEPRIIVSEGWPYFPRVAQRCGRMARLSRER